MFIMAMGRLYEKLAVKLTDWGEAQTVFSFMNNIHRITRNAQNADGV